MTFTQLRTFALVAELGSLRAAATALGVSEPAVSAAVAALRTDLGDPLFRRTGTRHRAHPGRPGAGRPRPGAGAAGRADPPGGRARDVHRPAAGAGDGGLRRARRRRGGRRLHPPGAARGRGPDRGLDRLRGGRAGRGRRRHRARRPAGADPGAGGRRRAVPAVLPRGRRGAGSPPGRAANLRIGDLSGHPWLTGPAGLEPGSEEERWADLGGAAPEVERCDSEAAALGCGAGRRGRDARARPTPSGRTSHGAPWSGCRWRARR